MKKKIQKKAYVNEYDALQIALAKVNLHEAVAPIVRGRIVEDADAYNKVQQLLDCPDMEHAHQFLLDVDFEDLTPEVSQKIDDLYQLAISQGYIGGENDESDDEAPSFEQHVEDEQQPQVSDASGGFENDVPNPEDAAAKDSIGINAPTIASCAYTLFYSAMKNGEIKTGECYSNATTMENAKLDAIQKLQKLGFTAVDIIAAEECDPNAKGCPTQQPEDFGAPINHEAVPSETTQSSQDEQPAIDDEDDDAETAEDDEEDEDSDEKLDEAESKEEAEDDEAAGEEEADAKKDEEEAEELSRSEKLDLFKSYLEEFKAILQKMKAECYAEMPLADRAKFYEEIGKAWAGKPDPVEFMSDDNVDQIEHMRIKLAK